MRPEEEERGRQLGIFFFLRNMGEWKINPMSHFDWSGTSPVHFFFPLFQPEFTSVQIVHVTC